MYAVGQGWLQPPQELQGNRVDFAVIDLQAGNQVVMFRFGGTSTVSTCWLCGILQDTCRGGAALAVLYSYKTSLMLDYLATTPSIGCGPLRVLT
jgi:hypothetical protein